VPLATCAPTMFMTERPTCNPGLDSLQTVHHGRVKPAGPLNAEGRGDEDKVQEPQVRFLVPYLLVPLSNALQAWFDMLFLSAQDGHGDSFTLFVSSLMKYRLRVSSDLSTVFKLSTANAGLLLC
jgi:hypothetical protein